ncbi:MULTISPECIES: AAA family ATPase [unclassified Mycobacterium]|uniref:AAA family ATPase n=1 Tax=unclassified Mycobacterium TaxID=2642494 RepID=UPI0009929211|nr:MULTISPECIES: AAA family ATPase [unclassified Mycobacterium]
MKLHRLSVTNYRGIAHRDITFPDRGVVVVSGANEIGKTSMIEALDLLIESKDRSTKKDVKQVKPTFADVGSEIEAEISCGAFRFVYRKRFHKRAETHLTVIEPRREQLSGDEAHQRVLDMLDQSIDMNLWKAQRVLQSAGAGVLDLSSSDALTRALDLAAGQSVALSGSEPDLVERIDAEYALYFTATGRPTGEWAKAGARLTAAEDALAVANAAVTEVDQQVREHDELTRDLATVIADRAEVSRRLAPLEQASQAVSMLLQQRDNATVVAEAAQAAAVAAQAKRDERAQLIADVQARRALIAGLAEQASAAKEAHETARQLSEAAESAATQATQAIDGTRAQLETARDTLDRALARDEVDGLAARVSRIDLTTRQLTAVGAELSGLVITAQSLGAIESAARAVGMAEVALDTASAQVEVRALADVDITVNGEQRRVEAGEQWASAATDTIEITAPGVAVTRIIPGANAAQLRGNLDAARAALAAALATVGVADIGQAQKQYERRTELHAERDRLTALLDGLMGSENLDMLRGKLSRLRELAPEATGLWDAIDPAQARAEVARLVTAVERLQAEEATHRQAVQVAAQRLVEKSTEATVLREKQAARAEELAASEQRLAQVRASASDDLLTERHEQAVQAADLTARRVTDLVNQLAALEADRVRAELAEVSVLAQGLDQRHEELRHRLRDIAVRLEVFGRQGRKDQLDAAASEREYAATEFTRIGAKARAVDTLRSVMLRHRDGMRLRYVDPFRAELERLGRMVFGPTFEVDVDSDLSIRSRTLEGRTVPYESLSGGAKEQLGIVARLASAALVAPEDAVPVIIDDALGFTDSDRLERMGEVFGAVGTEAQVIVLTCSPDRYDAVSGAHRISLSA